MVVKHGKVEYRRHHPVISKMRKALDKIEDDIAEKTARKVVHEMKEHERGHSKGCKCSKCKTHKKR
jgi:hypothetical protein